jgi:hypothetical protein
MSRLQSHGTRERYANGKGQKCKEKEPENKKKKQTNKKQKKQIQTPQTPFPEKTRDTWYPDFPIFKPTRQVEAEESSAWKDTHVMTRGKH